MSLIHEGQPGPRENPQTRTVEDIVNRIIGSTIVKTWPQKAQEDYRKGFV